MYKSKLTKVIVSLLRRILGVTRSGAKRLMRAMLRTLAAMARRSRLPVAGFVLPTVTMVLLVVILLTVAIVLRSFDRANLARNVRVNQQVLAAATPALDRAKAKLNYMLNGPRRPTATPSDRELYRLMAEYNATSPDIYSFGDETRLRLSFPLNGPTITNANNPQAAPSTQNGTTITENEAINTAWRYPVDTDNDGSYDTFTLYGIFFRSPPRNPTGEGFTRARKPLDARTPPMVTGSIRAGCEAAEGNVASLVGDSGWYRIRGRLQKSFFVYTVNVPITEDDINAGALFPANKPYEVFTGTPSISALEYQQDAVRIPLSNNAVVYEDDLDISPGVPLNINGRMLTNSNLLISSLSGSDGVKLYQVSSPASCFYDQENSKVIVAGNLINGNALNTNATQVQVHLFQGVNTPPNTGAVINTANQSVDSSTSAFQVLYNNNAYSNRLALLVRTQEAQPVATDPETVKLITGPSPSVEERRTALENYFKERLRKVPFAEMALGTTDAAPDITGSGDSLRPSDNWSLPTDGTAQEGGISGTGRAGLNLVAGQLQAANPDPQPETENFLGDRIQVGNNLPAQRWDATATPPGFADRSDPQTVTPPTPWNAGGGNRERTPQVTQLGDVGGQDRGGFWENSAAEIPRTVVDGVGGLRVITGAGVYERLNSFLPPPLWDDPRTPTLESLPTYDDPATAATEAFPIVWPDSMPMSPVPGVQIVYNNATTPDSIAPNPNTWATQPLPATLDLTAFPPGGSIDTITPKYAKGDLRMRATAVYHYAQNGYDKSTLAPGTEPDQIPIACVSSYYDPSNEFTARNIDLLPDVSGVIRGPRNSTLVGSNNGVVYGWSGTARPGPLTPVNGLFAGSSALETQANYVFPDGRFANRPLREALQKAENQRTLADKAAIDSTQCALDILAGAAPSNTIPGGSIPDGAIKEVAFLNAREIKAIERDDLSTPVDETFTLSSPLSATGSRDPNSAFLKGNYNLALEDRQPLEVRVTQLDIDQLRRAPATIGQNYPTAPPEEFLLPNSGIIYASRDDALPDRSDRTPSNANPELVDETISRLNSPTDSRLDPSRKPNGIMLVNGAQLFRRDTPTTRNATDVVVEKGLTLISNLPVYIQGNFNLHGRIDDPAVGFTEVEEFVDAQRLNRPSWNNFYTRTTLNNSFACRNGDSRLPDCQGDYWRPATVLADSVTVLSSNFRPGFRNEGDFDLRNNAGSTVLSTYDFDGTAGNDPVPAKLSRLYNGFFTNNFVTNGLSSGSFDTNGLINPLPATPPPGRLTDATYIAAAPAATALPAPLPVTDSSYFNNFVTPVQRRGNFPHYVMEVCVKLPTAACGPNDWFIDPPRGGSAGVQANTIAAGTPYAQALTLADASQFKAGTTANPPVPELQRFPRRVAFHRNASNQLVDASTNVVAPGNPPQPLGIGTANNVLFGEGAPVNDSLWFVASAGTSVNYGGTGEPPYIVNNAGKDGNGLDLPQLPSAPIPGSSLPATPLAQPLLMPVLQTQILTNTTASGPAPPPPSGANDVATNTRWLPRPTNTSQNLILVAGDTPSRAISPTAGDSNGGLQNLPRFVENWGPPPATGIATAANNIQGGFFQFNRSAYSTAPYTPILSAIPTDVPAPITPQNLPNQALQSLFALPSTPPASAPTGYTAPPASYNTSIGGGRIPFFSPPTRNWGYDVGLLSQPPDLFTQRFTTPPVTPRPAEYFREVSRDDDWVETLMCGVMERNTATPAINSPFRPTCPPT